MMLSLEKMVLQRRLFAQWGVSDVLFFCPKQDLVPLNFVYDGRTTLIMWVGKVLFDF